MTCENCFVNLKEAKPIDILDYTHPAVTVDTVLFTIMQEDLKVLLVQRRVEPFEAMWSLPGEIGRAHV